MEQNNNNPNFYIKWLYASGLGVFIVLIAIYFFITNNPASQTQNVEETTKEETTKEETKTENSYEASPDSEDAFLKDLPEEERKEVIDMYTIPESEMDNETDLGEWETLHR